MPRPKPLVPIAVTSLRIDLDLMEKVREMARKNRRSLSAEIAILIEEALEARANALISALPRATDNSTSTGHRSGK